MTRNSNFLNNLIIAAEANFYNKEKIYDNKLISKIGPINSWSKKFKDRNAWINKNEINKNFYRSDEFKSQHDGLHVVFTGCSYTFGTGLYLEETWSHILYSNLNNIVQCSGYYNLAIPGTSIENQIFELFKYFKEYGNPDVIFFNIPDISRFYFYDKNKNNFYDGFYNLESFETLKLLGYQYYFLLDHYCKVNNIKLFSFSWATDSTQFSLFNIPVLSFSDVLNKFNTFFLLTQQK